LSLEVILLLPRLGYVWGAEQPNRESIHHRGRVARSAN
jgi:hypothetical protein